MNLQYPHHPKVPLKDLPHTTKLRSDPNIIIQSAPPPVAHRWDPQYPFLPYDYPRVEGDLGTNLVKHIYEVRPLGSPRGWSIRRPSQLTTLQPKAGLYSPNGPIEDERSFLGGRGGNQPFGNPNERRLNLTGPKPQVKIREPVTMGPFVSPNPARGFMVWEDMGMS